MNAGCAGKTVRSLENACHTECLRGVFTTRRYTNSRLPLPLPYLYIAEIGIFDIFCSCDLDLDPMTFIYEHDTYSLEIYWMREKELPTSRLSKVII